MAQPLRRSADLPAIVHAETGAERIDRHNGGELAIRDSERSIRSSELDPVSRGKCALLGTEHGDTGEARGEVLDGSTVESFDS